MPTSLSVGVVHIIDWEEAKVIDKQPNKRTRQIKEAFWTRNTKASLNREEGNYELPACMMTSFVINTEEVGA